MTQKQTEHKQAQSPNTPKSERPYLSWLLWMVVLGLSWIWLIQPLMRINAIEPETPKQRAKESLPSAAFLKRVSIYQKALKSPIIGLFAKHRLALDLTKNITPSRIERSFRELLQKAPVTEWSKRFQRWDVILKTLERQLPSFDLQAYRVYLYLQAGQLQRLVEWSQKQTQTQANNRLQALFHIWMGHATFWAGYPKLASQHYQIAERGFATHPQWEVRSNRNWRLPSERSTMLYHQGLLELWKKQPQQAMQTFAFLAKRWTKLRKKSFNSVDIYMVRCLAAEAAMQMGSYKRATKYLDQADLFTGDKTQSTQQRIALLLASPNERKRARGAMLLAKLAMTRKRHTHSYTDTRAIATLHLSALMFKQKRYKRGWKHLSRLLVMLQTRPHPPTLSVLAAINTFPFRFLPASPQLYRQLLRYFPQERAKKHKHQAATLPNIRAAKQTPTSKQSTSQPTNVTDKKRSQAISLQQGKVMLQLLLGLSYLKRYDWKQAKRQLNKILSQNNLSNDPLRQQAHLYLGMLYTQQAENILAKKHLQSFCKAYPKTALGALYLANALRHTAPKQAWKQLKPWKKEYGWRSAIQTLSPTKKKMKKWQRLQVRAGFWWRLLGSNGLLTTKDTYLTRRTLYWQHRPFILHDHRIQKIFLSLRTSHTHSRFGLQTLLAKARIMTSLSTSSKRSASYAKQWRFLRDLYAQNPRLSYILDRTLYSHRLGTIALGFF